MAISLSNLENLDEANVASRLEQLTSIIEDLDAGVEVRRGAFHDLVLRMYSALGEAYSNATDTLVYSTVPQLSVQNTGAVDSSLLTAAADSQGITRQNGSTATGRVTIVVSENRSVLVPGGTEFTTGDGITVVTTQAFAARTSGSVVEGFTDRILSLRSDGNYEFTIDATAQVEGLAGNIAKNTAFTSVSTVLPYYVTSYAQVDFSGGNNEETDAQLLSRMLQVIPATSLSTRASVPAVIRAIDSVPELYNASTIGYGDCELQRGRNVIARMGKADTYVRTAVLPVTTEVDITATAVEVVDGDYVTWQLPLGRDDAPGFYYVAGVIDSEGSAYSDITLERGFDSSPIQGQLVPELLDATQAAFSRFSTATIKCNSAPGSVALGDTKTLTVQLVSMPYIAEIQEQLGSRDYRFVGGDTLVRGAIPVFVSVGVKVHTRPNTSLIDPADIRTSIANEFNLSGFATKIHGSRIATIANNLLPSGADVARVDFVAETLLPSGEICRSRTSDQVSAHNDCLLSATGRTCVFICDPAKVTITAYEETVPRIV